MKRLPHELVVLTYDKVESNRKPLRKYVSLSLSVCACFYLFIPLSVYDGMCTPPTDMTTSAQGDHPNNKNKTRTHTRNNTTATRRFQVEAGTTITSLLVAAVDREGNFIKSDKARLLWFVYLYVYTCALCPV